MRRPRPPKPTGGTDHLVAESERLRRVLMNTSLRLEEFSSELIAEAQRLKDEAAPPPEGDDRERGEDSADSPDAS